MVANFGSIIYLHANKHSCRLPPRSCGWSSRGTSDIAVAARETATARSRVLMDDPMMRSWNNNDGI